MSPSSPYRKGVAPIISPRGLKAGCLRDPRGTSCPFLLSGKASNKSSIVRRCAGKCAPTPPSTHTHTKSTFNMRTRSSAKSSAEQGPESTQGLKTAESSQKAPPKAAKPRGRVQGKPKSPPARKDAAKAKARNKSSNVEDVGTETGDATPPASLQDHVAPTTGHAGEPAKGAAAEKPPLGGSNGTRETRRPRTPRRRRHRHAVEAPLQVRGGASGRSASSLERG